MLATLTVVALLGALAGEAAGAESPAAPQARMCSPELRYAGHRYVARWVAPMPPRRASGGAPPPLLAHERRTLGEASTNGCPTGAEPPGSATASPRATVYALAGIDPAIAITPDPITRRDGLQYVFVRSGRPMPGRLRPREPGTGGATATIRAYATGATVTAVPGRLCPLPSGAEHCSDAGLVQPGRLLVLHPGQRLVLRSTGLTEGAEVRVRRLGCSGAPLEVLNVDGPVPTFRLRLPEGAYALDIVGVQDTAAPIADWATGVVGVLLSSSENASVVDGSNELRACVPAAAVAADDARDAALLTSALNAASMPFARAEIAVVDRRRMLFVVPRFPGHAAHEVVVAWFRSAWAMAVFNAGAARAGVGEIVGGYLAPSGIADCPGQSLCPAGTSDPAAAPVTEADVRAALRSTLDAIGATVVSLTILPTRQGVPLLELAADDPFAAALRGVGICYQPGMPEGALVTLADRDGRPALIEACAPSVGGYTYLRPGLGFGRRVVVGSDGLLTAA